MCLVLYLASDRPRPTIPWDAERPAFHVLADEPAAVVAAQFTKPHVYYLGSDQGCGCGFMQHFDTQYEDAGAEEKAVNQRGLHAYVSACLRDEPAVELFSCWSGDESAEAESDRTVRVADLLSRAFHFAERQRTVVRRDGS